MVVEDAQSVEMDILSVMVLVEEKASEVFFYDLTPLKKKSRYWKRVLATIAGWLR